MYVGWQVWNMGNLANELCLLDLVSCISCEIRECELCICLFDGVYYTEFSNNFCRVVKVPVIPRNKLSEKLAMDIYNDGINFMLNWTAVDILDFA